MRITSDHLEISENYSVSWQDVDNLRATRDTLCLVLSSGKVVEVKNLHPTTMDAAYRAYEAFLKSSAERSQRAPSRSRSAPRRKQR